MTRLTIGGMVLAAALGAAACGDDDNGPTGPSNTGPIVFSVTMTAAQEVPPITNEESNARGTATITFNVPRDSTGAITGGGSANFSIQLSGFPVPSAAQAAHIHPGAAGATGTVLVGINTLTPAAPIAMPDGTANVTFNNITLSQADATNITANPAGYYFNVHTPRNPGGAVRGQLVRQ